MFRVMAESRKRIELLARLLVMLHDIFCRLAFLYSIEKRGLYGYESEYSDIY